MSHTFEELKGKTVVELREIAAGLHEDAVKGYTQLNKEHLLELLCKALHIPMHAHHDVVGIDKSAIKGQIRELKMKRAAALAARDADQLKRIRRRIHRLKRDIHKHTR
jgi:DNA-binding IclR family transcriptional regulator